MLTGNISGALNTVMFPVVANRADDLEDAARLIRESIVFVGVADIICHCSPCGNSRRPLFRKPGAFDGQD